jgi:F-type H+-transporting ATPase subunit epsilon
MPAIEVIVVTPEKTALEEQVDFVVVPLFDGEKGIGTNHAPMIGRLGYGELRLKTGDRVTRYYVDGGFVQVVDNVVSILTNLARPAADLDAAAARSDLEEAEKVTANSPEMFEIRDRKVSQARAKLRVARK